MNTFRQHIPAFVDCGEDSPPLHEFETTADLLALEVVKRYSQNKGFSHFALNDNLLMEISDEGFRWWVVGRVSDPSSVSLPEWDGPKYMAKLADSTKTILSKEVVSSCGDVLTLRNGSKARNIRE
jgi:hypothetical protein